MKTSKKLVAFLIVLMFSVGSVFAQGGMGGGGGGGMGGPGGGMGGGPEGMEGQGGQSSRPTDFVASSGLFELDMAVVAKKVKIKDAQMAESFKAIVETYNKVYANVMEEHKSEVTYLKTLQVQMEDGATDMTTLRSEMQNIRSQSRVIRSKMAEAHKVLSAYMKELLTDKLHKKWAKYYEKVCEDNSFDPTRTGDMPMMQGGNSSGRGGQGGMSGGMSGGMGGGMSGGMGGGGMR